jgi:hypothetical protein
MTKGKNLADRGPATYLLETQSADFVCVAETGEIAAREQGVE